MKRFINSWLSSSKSYSENRSSNNAEPKVPDWYKNTGETEPDDELLKQVEEMKRGLNRETQKNFDWCNCIRDLVCVCVHASSRNEQWQIRANARNARLCRTRINT